MLELEKRLARFGIKPGLERIKKICNALGNPQDKLRVILVTGTNGKGSVTSYLSSILKEADYKVGSYYSPPLLKYNECFKINGKDISDREFRKYEKMILNLHKKGYEITLFEALTAIAYKYFADKDCDYAVIEIGMGGSYDATNIAKEDIAIITNVDLDHTEYLGDTIEKIAEDKAGIIKNNNGIVITACNKSALNVIKKKIKNEKKNTRMKVLNENFFVKVKNTSDKETRFDYIGENFYLNLSTSLIGRYQAINASLAVAAAEEIGVEEDAMKIGLIRAKNPGRLQTIRKNPLVVIDAAHNVHGIRELIANLDLFDYERLVCVFTAMKDKNWQEMTTLLAQQTDFFIATQIKNKRCESAENIAKKASRYTKAVATKNVKDSILKIKRIAKKADLILICGSIYMLGEAIKELKAKI